MDCAPDTRIHDPGTDTAAAGAWGSTGKPWPICAIVHRSTDGSRFGLPHERLRRPGTV